jgi:hypothetical protein
VQQPQQPQQQPQQQPPPQPPPLVYVTQAWAHPQQAWAAASTPWLAGPPHPGAVAFSCNGAWPAAHTLALTASAPAAPWAAPPADSAPPPAGRPTGGRKPPAFGVRRSKAAAAGVPPWDRANLRSSAQMPGPASYSPAVPPPGGWHPSFNASFTPDATFPGYGRFEAAPLAERPAMRHAGKAGNTRRLAAMLAA